MIDSLLQTIQPWYESALWGAQTLLGGASMERLPMLLGVVAGVFIVIGPLLGKFGLGSKKSFILLALGPIAFWLAALLGWAAADIFASPYLEGFLEQWARWGGLGIAALIVGMLLQKTITGMGTIRSFIFLGALSFLAYVAAMLVEAGALGIEPAQDAMEERNARIPDDK